MKTGLSRHVAEFQAKQLSTENPYTYAVVPDVLYREGCSVVTYQTAVLNGWRVLTRYSNGQKVEAARTSTCLYCHEPLTFTPGKGWHHQDGSVYKQRAEYRCPDVRCLRDRRFSSGHECPMCGLAMVPVEVDDHCATPDRQGVHA
ncbi:MAG: hypothetical protein ACT4P5_02295 [Armatimonadota bacterium]